MSEGKYPKMMVGRLSREQAEDYTQLNTLMPPNMSTQQIASSRRKSVSAISK